MANTQTVKDFFSSSEISRISIPKYQRNYSWSKEELRELWNDISNISVNSNIVSHKHFIGLVVLVESTENSAFCDVVDGQQRITTLTILLAVIRDIFTEEATRNLTPREAKKLNTEIQQINNLIFIDPTESVKQRKLIPNEQDKNFFFDITFDVGGESDSQTSKIEELFDTYNSEHNIFEIKTMHIKNSYAWKSAKFYKSYLAYEFFYESVKKQVEDQNLDLITFLKELKKNCKIIYKKIIYIFLYIILQFFLIYF